MKFFKNISSNFVKFTKIMLISFYAMSRYKWTMMYLSEKPLSPPNNYELSLYLGGYWGLTLWLFIGLIFNKHIKIEYVPYLIFFFPFVFIIIANYFIKRIGGEEYVMRLSEKYMYRYKVSPFQTMIYLFYYMLCLFLLFIVIVVMKLSF